LKQSLVVRKKPLLNKVPENISGLLHPYHDRYLADSSLSDTDVLLLSIYLIELENSAPGAGKEESRELFVSLGRRRKPNFDVAFHRAKKHNLVDIEENGKVIFRIEGLKLLEMKIGLLGKTPVHLIKAGQNFSGIKLFEEFLQDEMIGNVVLLCDSHVSSSTLFPFSTLAGKVTHLRILTSNLYDTDKFKAYLAKLGKEVHMRVEVRQTTKIHDRYLICGEKGWSIGASIKDLGNKDTIITELPGIASTLKELFEERWIEAIPV
jgi:hypothetical protein